MAKRRLWNWWTAKRHNLLHGLTAAAFVLLYLLGAAGLSPEIPLREIGIAGFFTLILILFLHQNLCGTRRFLDWYSDTDRLPSRQIQQISSACILLFLFSSGVGIAAAAFILPRFCARLASWLSGRVRTFDITDEALFFEESPAESPDLSAFAGEPSPTPSWVILLNQLLELIGILFLAALCLLFLWQTGKHLWHILTKPRNWDDDERISLRPALFEKQTSGKAKRTHRLPLPVSLTEKERIRRLYRKRISAGYRKKGAKDIPAAWMSPQELEQAARIQDDSLHLQYEEARYGK